MGNNLVTAGNLPAHLQGLMCDTRLTQLNADAAKGLAQGSWPRISLKGGRFRLQDPQGQEFVVPVNQLDVVIVATNPHGLSKKYYSGAYDPAGDGTAPDCYSDNGVAPSKRAAKPQSGTCAACPHNAWGSKVTPAGAQTKSCADVKKFAVLLADNTSGPVFEVDVPAASLANFGAYVRSLDAAGIPVSLVVTRLVFDTDADYPKLTFSMPPVMQGQEPWQHYPYISADMKNDVLEVVGSDEVKLCTGENDQPITAAPALSAGSQAGQASVSSNIPGSQIGHAVGANADYGANAGYGPVRAPLAPPQHVSGAPLPVGQVGPTPPPNPAFPHTGAPAQAPKTRTRRTKAQMEAEAQPVGPQVTNREAAAQASNTPGTPSFFKGRRHAADAPPPVVASGAPVPANGRDATAPINPPVTDAAMDDMLRQAMST